MGITYKLQIMRTSLIIVLVFAVAGTVTTAADDSLDLNLPDGALCVSGLQCASKCCKRNLGHFNHCDRLSKEGEQCDDHFVDDRYSNRPCEYGLKCTCSGLFCTNVCTDP